MLTYADRLLRLADETVSEMRTGKPKGVFRLGSLESTAGSRLAPILSRYHSVYPDVVVELATGTTGALVTRVVNFELEAAFVSEPFTAPSLQARRVFEERLVLVTSKAICKVSGPADLGRSTLIAFAQGCSYRKRIEEWLGSANVMPERIYGICLVSGDDRLRRCRYRICCGAQICSGDHARDQERTPTRAPEAIFAQPDLYRVAWRSVAVAAVPAIAFGHCRRMMAPSEARPR